MHIDNDFIRNPHTLHKVEHLDGLPTSYIKMWSPYIVLWIAHEKTLSKPCRFLLSRMHVVVKEKRNCKSDPQTSCICSNSPHFFKISKVTLTQTHYQGVPWVHTTHCHVSLQSPPTRTPKTSSYHDIKRDHVQREWPPLPVTSITLKELFLTTGIFCLDTTRRWVKGGNNSSTRMSSLQPPHPNAPCLE